MGTVTLGIGGQSGHVRVSAARRRRDRRVQGAVAASSRRARRFGVGAELGSAAQPRGPRR